MLYDNLDGRCQVITYLMAQQRNALQRVSLPFLLATILLFINTTQLLAQSYDLSVIAKEGDTISGKTLTRIGGGSVSMNNSGTTIFVAEYAGGEGIFTANELLVAIGDTIGGKVLTDIYPSSRISDTGDIVFQASFAGGKGVFTQHRLVAAIGDIVAGKSLSDIGITPSINNLGEVAFSASFSGGPGIFTESNLVAQLGDVIDGRTLGGFSINNFVPIDNSSDVFFASGSSGGQGTFTGNSLVAAVGDIIDGEVLEANVIPVAISTSGILLINGDQDEFPAPRLFTLTDLIAAPGDTIDGQEVTSIHREWADINDSGTVAFIANNTLSIFTQDSFIAGQGTIVDGLTLLYVTDDPSINNSGAIAVWSKTNGGHAVIVATPVPEPAAITLLATLGLLSLGMTRRRRRR